MRRGVSPWESMPREKRDHLRDNFNVGYGSIQSLGYALRKLQLDGLTDEQVLKGVSNLHPALMGNLEISVDGEITVKDDGLTWLRCSWISKDVLPYVAAIRQQEYTEHMEQLWAAYRRRLASLAASDKGKETK
jgi:hypothetical protein